jgi:hypothetical protein
MNKGSLKIFEQTRGKTFFIKKIPDARGSVGDFESKFFLKKTYSGS